MLSSTVAKALRLTGGEEALETAQFVDMFDKFFDCLNVTNFHAGKHKRKVFQDPFRPNDFRLTVSEIFGLCVVYASASMRIQSIASLTVLYTVC